MSLFAKTFRNWLWLLALNTLNRSKNVVVGMGIISECNSRLPMSLSTVISDLEAEGVKDLNTACFLTSRGVTQAEKADFFGLEDTSTTAFGTDSGLCIALSPSSIAEAASTAVACGGSLVYFPDEDDLSRGEGLFDTLGPAIERILNENLESSKTLIVVSVQDPLTTKAQLENVSAGVLRHLASSSKKVTLLEDVFDSIKYVQTSEEAMELLKAQASIEPSQAQATVATTVASDFWQTSASLPSMSAADLAAARQLGPAAPMALETALERVRELSDGGAVVDFGDLCSAATERAMDDFKMATASRSSALASSTIGKQIRANLKEDIAAELAGLCEKQLDLLRESCFEEFRKDLSKLRISPNLANDMDDVVKKAVASFAARAKKMPISTANAKVSFNGMLKEFCAERLLAAKASGQFRPVPRKGVGIGFHWLLPKPFGNDYRQEPWMVHATDNLVYVPTDKITDVSPEDVAAGDWRRKIVPSPAGNEMLYMQ